MSLISYSFFNITFTMSDFWLLIKFCLVLYITRSTYVSNNISAKPHEVTSGTYLNVFYYSAQLLLTFSDCYELKINYFMSIDMFGVVYLCIIF